MAANRVAMLFLLGTAASALFTTGCGKPQSEPVLAENIMDYKTLFAQNCQGCHGENGSGGAVQRLNDPIYLAIVPEKTLHDTIENGRPGTLMPAFAREKAGPLYPKQIDALVNGIEQNWGKPRADAHSLPPYTANSPGDPARGLQVFNKACAMCHGAHGPVGPITDPSFLSLISDQDLRTIVIIGRPKLGMPDWRNHGLGRPMTNTEITDVVAYLASLRPSPLPGTGAQTNNNGEGNRSGANSSKRGGK
jgi:mono/diheme cytochrome c family protein